MTTQLFATGADAHSSDRKPLQRGRWRAFGTAMLLGLVCMGGATEFAMAQTERAAESRGTLEEIVVTARRRDERLQDTPISLTAFTGGELSAKGIDGMGALGQAVPNLTFDQGAGNTGGSGNAQVYIRGIGQQDFLFTTDPGVGIYIDEVYFPRSLGNMLDLVDLERVEVLRGPQGTLFGRNTIGGAISIVSARPDSAEFNAKAALTVGEFHRSDTQASVNIPIVANELAVRLSMSSLNRDGYVRRLSDGVKTGDINSDGARVALLWTPTENVSALFSADYTRKREESIADVLIAANNAASYATVWNARVGVPVYGTTCCQPFLTGNIRTTHAAGKSQSDLDLWGGSANIEVRLPAVTFKSITAYREQSAEFGNDADFSPLPYADMTNVNDQHSFSQELQIQSGDGANRLDWVLGTFYSSEKASDAFRSMIGVGLYPRFPVLAASLDRLRLTSIENESSAVFGQGTLKWTESVSATAGVRYTRDEKTFTSEVLNIGANLYTVPAGTRTKKSWDSVSATVALQRRVFDDSMVYVSGSSGFKSGGFNGRAKNVSEATSTFDPEEVLTYEVGYKGVLFDKRMTLNVSAYFNDYKDLQLLIIAPNFDILATNAGKAETKGFEAELNTLVGDSFRVSAGVGYVDAKYTELASNVSGLTLGNRMPKTPEWTGSVGAEYTFQGVADGSLTIRGDYAFKSSYFHVPSTLPIMRQDAYGLLSAQLTYAHASGKWEMTLLGTNLADEKYTTNAIESLGFMGIADATYGRPRELGARVTFRF